MELILLSIEASDGIWTAEPSYSERKRRVNTQEALFLAVVGCRIPVKRELWRKKECKETVLSLLEADLLYPEDNKLNAAEEAMQEGLLELWRAAGADSGLGVWSLIKMMMSECSLQELEMLEKEMPEADAEQVCSRLLQQGLDAYGVFGMEGNLRLQKLIFRASTGRTIKREQTGEGNMYHEEAVNRKK